MKTSARFSTAVTAFAVLQLLSACVSPFHSHTAGANAVKTRGEVLALMDKATESYADHEKEIDRVSADLEDAYKYEATRSRNKVTVALWDQLIHISAADPNSGVFPRFVALWKTQSTLSPGYISRKKQNVGQAFQRIIDLESARAR